MKDEELQNYVLSSYFEFAIEEARMQMIIECIHRITKPNGIYPYLGKAFYHPD
jgi:hypothetical protein